MTIAINSVVFAMPRSRLRAAKASIERWYSPGLIRSACGALCTSPVLGPAPGSGLWWIATLSLSAQVRRVGLGTDVAGAQGNCRRGFGAGASGLLAGFVFALRTTDGGALVFYDLTASLLLGTPDAEPFSITIPGIFNGKVQRPVFTVNYYEQFAVSETRGSGAKPRVVANDSGPVGGTCDGGDCQ
jgi:hypothetical protein